MATSTASRTRTSSRATSSPRKRTSSAVAGTAKRQAGNVADTANQSAGDVVATGKEQASAVASEAMGQAEQLLEQASSQLREHATTQQQRLTANIRQLAEHFSSMADAGEPGSASSLVRQIADRTHQAAGYLEGKEPGDIIEDIQRIGRRRPGAFLLGAAIAGLAAGRTATAVKNAPETTTTANRTSRRGTTTSTSSRRTAATSRTTGAGSRRPLAAVEPYPDAKPGGGW